MMQIKNKIIYPDLSYKITGILFQIHKELGRFCKERQYSDIFETNLIKHGIMYEKEKLLNPYNKADFIIENKIVVELKVVPFITKNDYYQIMRYLKSAGLKLGLLVNLRSRYLKPKRILNSDV